MIKKTLRRMMFVIYAPIKNKQVSSPTYSSLAVQKRKITLIVISSNTFSVVPTTHLLLKAYSHALSNTV